jgi:exonuclease SbcC
MEYVAEEYLFDMADSASKLLLELTNGRYNLTYQRIGSDSDFFVGDNFDEGRLRNVSTLSGGETFLVSLTLAVSLSETIYQKSLRPMEFFFLDEGFGTLDGGLIEVVLNSLEKLKDTHFSIGLISHVQELKERISSKILVTAADEKCGSKIEIIY